MNIVVNGKPIHVNNNQITIQEFIRQRSINTNTLAVEYNGSIIPQEAYTTTRLNEGDHLEIVTFVGGG
ncbi:MAG: sulfur carrier protein ThiS [Elusimicrobia bacterium]|nr:sulfur carrier protein ThiS [Elusimicrobiota bacterium]MBD3412348.1 sulfur carrier protein ThiS [Elusimicrobiota bacterium]